MSALNPKQQRFVDRATRRSTLFLRLSIVGVVFGVFMLCMAGYRAVEGAGGGSAFIIGILVLLNARQNLRQHKYAEVLKGVKAGSVQLEAHDDRQVV